MPRERLVFFSCGHIVPPHHLRLLLVARRARARAEEGARWGVGERHALFGLRERASRAHRSGPTNKQFDFTHKSRGTHEQIDELGRLLVNTCTLTPEGVVCFLPSFDYECAVMDRWAASGTLAQLSKRKRVFREPRAAREVDAVLRDYSAASDGVRVRVRVL